MLLEGLIVGHTQNLAAAIRGCQPLQQHRTVLLDGTWCLTGSDTEQAVQQDAHREKCCDHCLVAFVQGRINLQQSRFGAPQMLRWADISSNKKFIGRGTNNCKHTPDGMTRSLPCMMEMSWKAHLVHEKHGDSPTCACSLQGTMSQ